MDTKSSLNAGKSQERTDVSDPAPCLDLARSGELLFTSLAQRIEHAWSRHGYSEGIFPKLAADALRAMRIWEQVQVHDLLRNVFLTSTFERMHDIRHFGDLQITVFRSPKFFIEVLFWTRGSPFIHDHAFCGAFCVLDGAAIQTKYVFKEAHRENSRFRIGILKPIHLSRLSSGAVEAIHANDKLIHSTFHISNPSVSLVVRTPETTAFTTQLEYRPPHVAADTKAPDVTAIKKAQAVSVLAAQGHLVADTLVDGLARCSLEEVYWICRSVFDSCASNEQINVREALLRRPFGREILATVTNERRVRTLLGMRARTNDHAAREFVAALMHAPTKRALKTYISQIHRTKNIVRFVAAGIEGMQQRGFLPSKGDVSPQSLRLALIYSDWRKRVLSKHGTDALAALETIAQAPVMHALFNAP